MFIVCSWNAASYDNLLGSNKLFPQPIPLNVSVLKSNSLALRENLGGVIVLLATDAKKQEMVDFLVEVWEQDGLYD